jgi:ecotin
MELKRSGKASGVTSFVSCASVRFLLFSAFTLSALMAVEGEIGPTAAMELKAFPPAGEGMSRFVIMLPPRKDEELLKVQLLVGKIVKLDPQNRYFFGGKLETETITGWGYERYILKNLGPMAGTIMAVDPSEPKVDRYITLGGDPELLRYNSRIPLVVYVPNDVEVRYRIWTAEGKIQTAPKG